MSTRIEKYWYVVLGSMVGAGVALLLAPQTGQKTRKQIAKYGKKAGSRAQVFVGDIAESLDCVVRDALEYGGTGLKKERSLLTARETKSSKYWMRGRNTSTRKNTSWIRF